MEDGWRDVFDGVRWFFTIITPFAVLALGIRAASRKKLMESIDAKMERFDLKIGAIGDKIIDSNDECRRDIQALSDKVGGNIEAVRVQLSDFQRTAAGLYPTRREVTDEIRQLRQEIRNDSRDR